AGLAAGALRAGHAAGGRRPDGPVPLAGGPTLCSASTGDGTGLCERGTQRPQAGTQEFTQTLLTSRANRMNILKMTKAEHLDRSGPSLSGAHAMPHAMTEEHPLWDPPERDPCSREA